jgi:hypothetical protein
MVADQSQKKSTIQWLVTTVAQIIPKVDKPQVEWGFCG